MQKFTASHIPRKRFGQHFLHDKYIIHKIVDAIAPHPNDNLIEIGPGLGALTCIMLPHVKRMTAIELDYDLIPKLQEKCKSLGNLVLYQEDALKVDFAKLSDSPASLRIFGNLPYNISTPLIFHLLHYIEYIKDMHFMLQKEVVERMAAQVGSKAYGRLSIMLQYYCDVELLFYVSHAAFTPPPQVESAVVRLIPKRRKQIIENPILFAEIVKEAFNHRRKTLRNVLKQWLEAQDWQNVEVNSSQRPEQLNVEDFIKIANWINTNQK